MGTFLVFIAHEMDVRTDRLFRSLISRQNGFVLKISGGKTNPTQTNTGRHGPEKDLCLLPAQVGPIPDPTIFGKK